MTVAAAIAAALGAVVSAYPMLDSIAREKNSKQAVRIRKELNTILSKYNLKISDLRNEIEKRGLSYNKLVEALGTVSPAGRANKVREHAYSNKAKQDAEQMSQINKLQNQADIVSAEYGKRAEDYDSRGVIRTILH